MVPDNNIKVAFLKGVISRRSGGLFNSVKMLANELDKEHNLFASILGYVDQYTAEDIKTYLPIVPVKYKIIGPKKLGYTIDLKEILEVEKPDILHPQCLWLYQNYHSLCYHKKTKAPIIISPRGMIDKWAVNRSTFMKHIVRFLYESEHLNSAFCFHALAQSEALSIKNAGYKKEVAIIPNGVHLPNRYNLKIVPPKWYDPKFMEGKKIMLFLGRIDPKKGLENLIVAWNSFSESNKEWILCIAGWGNNKYENSLRKLVGNPKKNNQIYFIGPQFLSEKEATFSFSNAFILPSFSEGLPMAILEAWSYKLPVLMTNECNIPIGFVNNAAIKIKPNVKSILEKLKMLNEMDSNELVNIGENGYNLVSKKFTWATIAKQMRSIYEWSLGGSKPTDVEIL